MMKNRGIVVALMIGLLLGVVGMAGVVEWVGAGAAEDSTYSPSPLPGGGLKVAHNNRIHLSTDQQWVHSEGHLSDLIRLQWTGDRAKPAIAWVNEQGLDKTAIVSHSKANDPSQPDHNHISIETTMSPDGKYPNQLFTRFEIPFDQDIAEIRTHSSNFNVMDGILRIAGSEGVNRDLQFANASKGHTVVPRWAIRVDTSSELGAETGSDFRIVRYSDDGEAIDTPLAIVRKNGNVGIGNHDATSKLDVDGDSIRIRSPKTPTSANSACHVGEMSWDQSYLYMCVGENTWKRTSLDSW